MSAKVIRIFISSPGDVGAEREKVREIFARLQVEFSGVLKLEPYFWEHEPMRAHTDFQSQIEPPSRFDLFICLLWARLGSRLHPGLHRKVGGEAYASGTEYELLDALESFRRNQAPEILIYKRQADPVVPVKPKEERERILSQYDALESFFARLTQDDGHFVVGSNNYTGLEQFEAKFEGDMRKVLERYVPAGVAGTRLSSQSWTAGNPYQGLRHFEFEHAPVFFGRTGAIDEVLASLRTKGEEGAAFVLIFGGSGVGKSSLARAGVLPWLVKPGVIDGVGLWRRGVIRPSEAQDGDLFGALARALMQPHGLAELGADGTTVEELGAMLRQAPGGVGMLIKGALSQAAREVQVAEKLERQPRALFALLVDQLEELFTNGQLAEQRGEFLSAIDALARSGFVWVIATLRSDFYSRCEEQPILMELKKGAGQYHLQPPDEVQLGQMIRLPAAAAGLFFEEDRRTGERLDDLLRDAAIRNPGALPLLEFVLEELYLQRDEQHHLLRLAVFRELGGVAGALGKRAAASLAKASSSAQESFDLVFRQLVGMSAGEQETPVRRRARKAEIGQSPGARELVEQLTTDRLLVADRGEDGVITITLAHEALLTAWDQLARWVERHRESLAARNHVALDAARWLRHGRADDYLYSGGLPLEKGRALLQQGFLGADEMEFVQASISRADQKARRKLRGVRMVAGAFALLALGASAAAVLAVWSEKEAISAREDADSLNGYLLGDLRIELEEIGRLDLLDSAATHAAQYLQRLADQSKEAGRRAQILQLAYNIGRVRLAQGRLQEAAEVLRTVVYDDPALAIPGARVLDALCDLLARTGDNAEGQAAADRALTLLAGQTGEESQQIRSNVLINLADLQRQKHDLARASASLAQAMTGLDELLQRTPSRAARRLRLRAMLRQGDIALALRQTAAAQAILESRLRNAQEYATSEPTTPLWKAEVALSHDRLALFWLRQSHSSSAAAAAEAALQQWQQLIIHDPNNLEWRRLEATAQIKRGQVFLAEGNLQAARDLFTRAVETAKQLTEAAPGNLEWLAGLATARSLLSDALADGGEIAAGLREAELALETRGAISNHPSGKVDIDNARTLTLSLIKTANLLMENSQYARAEQLAEQAHQKARELAQRPNALTADHALQAAVLESLGEAAVGQERQAEGVRLYQEAKHVRQSLVRDFPREPDFRSALADCQEALAGLYKDQGALSEAQAEIKAAGELRRHLAQEFPADPAFQKALQQTERAWKELAAEAGI